MHGGTSTSDPLQSDLMARSFRYRRLARRRACENQRFEVFFDKIEAPSGEIVNDFLIVRPRISAPWGIIGVCVLPEVDGRIGLMRGYRHQLDEEVWQAPAGFIESGETAERAALRELVEETGLSCGPTRLRSLGVYLPDSGLIEGRVALFLAHRCVRIRNWKSDREIGAGGLQFFDLGKLANLVRRTRSMGGSTLVACLRLLMRKSPVERRQVRLVPTL